MFKIKKLLYEFFISSFVGKCMTLDSCFKKVNVLNFYIRLLKHVTTRQESGLIVFSN